MAVFAGKSRIVNGGGNDRAILDSFYSFPNTVGNIYFVYSGATGVGTGISPTDAFTTLQAAHDAATADNGDIIYILPGHAESIIGAGTIALTKSGLTIIGLGNGRKRPLFSWTTGTNAKWNISGANTTIRNICMDWSGFDAIVACIGVTAADVWFDNIEVNIAAAAAQPLIGILTAATATRFKVTNSRFLGLETTTGATFTGAIKHEVGVDFLIDNCYFRCKGTQAILNATTILGGVISNCYIHMYTGTKGIALAAGTTGAGINNRIVVPSGTAPIVGAGFTWIGNIYGTEALTIGTPTAAPF